MRAEFYIFESNAPGLKANFYEPYVDMPTRYTRTLVVKPALSQMYDQVEVPRSGMQKLLHSYVGAPPRACTQI